MRLPKARSTGCTKVPSAILQKQAGSTLSAGPDAACTARERYPTIPASVKASVIDR